MEKRWKISEVARLAHVTVRTLHHYDEIGLLVPSEWSDAGYRLYSESDLARLHQILLYRELGFALEAISRLLDEPAIDRETALRAQRDLLVEKRKKMDAVIRAVDRRLESIEKGKKMSEKEMFDGINALSDAPEDIRAHQAKHAREVSERWGGTDAYRESLRRVKDYSKEDWAEIKEQGDQNEARMASLLAAGADTEGEEAMAGAERMRQHISDWFYPCSYEMHAGLADMYEADPRFAAHYEKRAKGLAGFVADAIRANAVRAWDEGGS